MILDLMSSSSDVSLLCFSSITFSESSDKGLYRSPKLCFLFPSHLRIFAALTQHLKTSSNFVTFDIISATFMSISYLFSSEFPIIISASTSKCISSKIGKNPEYFIMTANAALLNYKPTSFPISACGPIFFFSLC